MNRLLWFFLLLISAFFYYVLGYELERNQFALLISLVLLLFLTMPVFKVLLKSMEDEATRIKWIQIGGVLFRLILLFSVPQLSDDYFRFLWDGTLSLNGLNPYLSIPSDLIDKGNISDYQMSLYEGMNSPKYHTVYPPMNQFIFAVSAGNQSVVGGILTLRGILLISELLSMILLPKLLIQLSIKPEYALFYILNPLVILEGVGNLHFEVITVLFLILTIHYLLKEEYVKSALSFFMAVSVKLIPFLLVPVLMRHLGWKRSLFYFPIVLALFFVLFMPFLDAAFLKGLTKSIGLYFHSFEFNASVYYLLRSLGYWWKGYNMIQAIGALLAGLVFLMAIGMALSVKKKNMSQFLRISFFTFLFYYICSTTVHPWYLINVLFLALLSGFHRSITFWTFLSYLSYSAYSNPGFQEDNLYLWIEYLGFALAFLAEVYLPKIRNLQTL